MATQLANDDLKTAVAGKTVTIDTPLGLPITVNYSANGLMTGTVGTALAVYLGSAKDRGRWQVRDGKLCQKWFKWLSGETKCLTLRQDGTKIHWRSDEGQTGIATIEPGPPAFDGVTASGLGLPTPPKQDQAQAKEPSKHDRARAHPAAPSKPTAEDAEARTVAPHKASPRTEPRETDEPPLVHAIAPAARPKYVLASLSPVPFSIFRPDRNPPAVETSRSDLFDGTPLPLRHVAQESANAMLENRWCHSNAFAKEPAAPDSAERFAAPELVSVPSLLAVAQEQAYDGELPLHEASCLTADPAISVLAKSAMSDDAPH